MTKDKYDKAIEYLTENPDEISNAWHDGNVTDSKEYSPGSHLFVYCHSKPRGQFYSPYGCLTLVRKNLAIAETKELTKQIREDERIPESLEDITVEDLPVFAEWQRKLDKELDRT